MPESHEQTQGQAEATADIEATDVIGPEDELDVQTVDAEGFGQADTEGDPLAEIEGADRLPQEDQQRIRDAYLRKMSELDRIQKTLQERDREYLETIRSLKGEDQKQTNFEGMSPEQIVEAIAERKATELINERFKSVDGLRERSDAVVRQLQIIHAAKDYPDIDRYQGQLTDFAGVLENELGKEKALKFSVTDMMHIIKGRERARQKPVQRAKPAPATRKPDAAIARSGVAPSTVEPSKEPSTMAEAWELAKKTHGEYRGSPNR